MTLSTCDSAKSMKSHLKFSATDCYHVGNVLFSLASNPGNRNAK